MKNLRKNGELGQVNMFLVTTIIFVVLAIGLGVGFGWSYLKMTDYKDNLDSKIATAIDSAKEEQKRVDTKQFDEDYKKPNNVYTSPANYGSVSFEYPKTWSTYVDNDGSTGNAYKAYFNPVSVPPVKNTTPYALRVTVVNSEIDTVLKSYEAKIKKGDLKSSPIKLEGAVDDPNDSYGKGTRIDGQFDKVINGSAVFFDIRGRTLGIFTDTDTFTGDFNNTILKTLKYLR
jgi:hypothetical protein